MRQPVHPVLLLWLPGLAVLAMAAAPAPPALPTTAAVPATPTAVAPPVPVRTPAQLYATACAACHGPDGRGAAAPTVGFATPLPDLTDCNFATREPDADWGAIIRQGGPVRGFAPMMPAFGEALNREEQTAVLGHVRTLCREPCWPRGELNLPRATFTEKAYIEDEAVLTLGAPLEGSAKVTGKLIYEQRFGRRNQFEVILPFTVAEGEDGLIEGLGDVALGVKRVLAANDATGTIVSAAAELLLPTGDEADGLGRGHFAVEPFLAAGQLLPDNSFLHVQVGAELPLAADAEQEGFLRAALGTTFAQDGGDGRSWTPMVELLAVRELDSGAPLELALAPQLQVSVNTRQHLLAALAVRVPLTDRETRPEELWVYLLWDWFDGGLTEGW